MKNGTNQRWDVTGPNYFRLGLLLKAENGDTIRELQGVRLPQEIAQPGGQGVISVPVTLPESVPAVISW